MYQSPRRPRRPRAIGAGPFAFLAQSGIALLLMGSLIVVLPLVAAGTILSRPDLTYLAVAILLPVPLLAIGILRGSRFDLFEPINVTTGAIIFGTTMRAFYLVFLPDRPSAQRLMLQQSFAEVNANVIWILIGIISFCFGYILIGSGRSNFHDGAFRPRRIETRRYNFILLTCLALSVIGCAAYISVHNIDLRGDILGQSHKRYLLVANQLGDEVYATGWQAQLANFGLYAGAGLAGAMISRNVRTTAYRLALMLALLFFGFVVPFFSSARTPIILTVFSIFVFGYYYGRIKLRGVVIGLVTVVLVTSAMGELRAINSNQSNRSGDLIDGTIGSGNGFDTVRSTAIIERVPSRAGYLYGTSYLALPVFWVPRQIWPGKPETGLGAWVKEKLFGVSARQSGWPPGFIAEAYINFGYIGIVFLPFFIGMAMRWFYEMFRPYLGISFLATTFYSLIIYKVGFDTPSLNVAQGLITGMLSAFPSAIIIYLSSRKTIRRPAAGSARRDGRARLGPRPPNPRSTSSALPAR